MQENVELVQRGFRCLVRSLSGYIGQELSRKYKSNWWDEVLRSLNDQYDLPWKGSYGDLVDSLDVANCIRLIQMDDCNRDDKAGGAFHGDDYCSGDYSERYGTIR